MPYLPEYDSPELLEGVKNKTMKTRNNIITPRERLHIAAQIVAGVCGNGINPLQVAFRASQIADELITACGCIVADAPEVLHEMD